jgi:5S rRNA maturation endonuclease (ribonuclease M5)
MQDLAGNVLGIRLRTLSGKKFAVRGGREGLFIPDGLAFSTDLLVSEGPTDTAALLDLGFEAIGRPCSSGGTRLIIALVKARKPPAIVIVADVDANGVGQRGAEALASSLVPYHASVRTIFPPNNSKDARGWKQAGATPADVQAAVDAAPERSLRVERRII